jgi:hypothetical protein
MVGVDDWRIELELSYTSHELSVDMRPPPVIFHYTDAAGFFGIISTSCLHATHHRFLNDTGEVTFGLDAARRIVAEFEGKIGATAKSRLAQHIDELSKEDSYIACLSKRHDALSQWRAYADNGAGYCIGIRVERRTEGFWNETNHWSSHLVECLYGKEVDDRLRSRFNHVLERLSIENPIDRDELIVTDFSRAIRRYAHVAKHPHFQEEEEWRFIIDAPPQGVEYRIGRRGLTPFRPTDTLPIVKVWIGPNVGPSPRIALETVTRFLEKNGVTGAEVEFWESPFRR